jgi:hypothetical protein
MTKTNTNKTLDLGTWLRSEDGTKLIHVVRLTEKSAWVQPPNGTTLGKTIRFTRRVRKSGEEYLSQGSRGFRNYFIVTGE